MTVSFIELQGVEVLWNNYINCEICTECILCFVLSRDHYLELFTFLCTVLMTRLWEVQLWHRKEDFKIQLKIVTDHVFLFLSLQSSFNMLILIRKTFFIILSCIFPQSLCIILKNDHLVLTKSWMENFWVKERVWLGQETHITHQNKNK